MRKILALGALLGVVAFLTTAANAQRPPFGGGMFGGGGGLSALIANKGVQEELKMTDEQKEKAAEKAKGARTKFQEIYGKLKDVPKEEFGEKMAKMMKEVQESVAKDLGEVLKPEQMKRLKQIERQQNVLTTLTTDDDTKKELKLSEEQLTKLKGISDDMRKEMTGLFGGFKENPKETGEKMATLRKDAREKALNSLTDDQKKTWKDLTGEPFEVKFEGFNFGKKPKDN